MDELVALVGCSVDAAPSRKLIRALRLKSTDEKEREFWQDLLRQPSVELTEHYLMNEKTGFRPAVKRVAAEFQVRQSGDWMRDLSFDQYEFASPGSKQSLQLVIAEKRQCPDLRSFAIAGCGYTEPYLSEFLARVEWRPLAGYSRLGQIEKHLIEFALVELPAPTACRLFVLSDRGYQLDVLLELPDRFVRYNWLTTA